MSRYCSLLRGAALGACMLAGPLAVKSHAAPVLNPANGHYYERVDSRLDWTGARDAAAVLTFSGAAGHLATITSADEQSFILNNLGGVTGLNTYWLGGYQDTSAPDYSEPTGGWRWVTGEAFTYTNWAGGEPNNAGNEHHLHFWNGGGWNDIPGSSITPGFVVEYEAASTAIPEPGAMALLLTGLPGLLALRRRR